MLPAREKSAKEPFRNSAVEVVKLSTGAILEAAIVVA
jgi:hypothetical protein